MIRITESERRIRTILRNDNSIIIYRFVNYYDVWGNSKEGFEVNNLCNENIFIVGDNWKGKDCIVFLKKIGFLRKRFRFNIVDDYDSIAEIEYTKEGRPVGRFEKIIENGDLLDIVESKYLRKTYNSTFIELNPLIVGIAL